MKLPVFGILATPRDRGLRQRLERGDDALAEGRGPLSFLGKQRDLGDVAGTWKADRVFEAALASQDRVDQDLWPKKRRS